MDGSGMLNFPEFLAMMGYKVTGWLGSPGHIQAEGENAEDEIREAFQVFDGVMHHSIHQVLHNYVCQTLTQSLSSPLQLN